MGEGDKEHYAPGHAARDDANGRCNRHVVVDGFGLARRQTQESCDRGGEGRKALPAATAWMRAPMTVAETSALPMRRAFDLAPRTPSEHSILPAPMPIHHAS
jgi:hypothetical protein